VTSHMVEAESDEVCEKYVDSVIEVIKAKGHIAANSGVVGPVARSFRATDAEF